MLKVEYKLTGTQLAAKRASATPQALKNLFFGQVDNMTKIMWEKTHRNALEFPETPTGRLASSIRMNAIDRGNQRVGWVIADERIAPYAEWVEYGHFAGPKESAKRTWVPGLHFMEQAFLETRRESHRRISAGFKKGLKWYDYPGAVHRETGEVLATV